MDLKQSGDRVVVIEVNDNPNVDAGVEDLWLGEDLYRQIMLEFPCMEARRLGLPPDAGLDAQEPAAPGNPPLGR